MAENDGIIGNGIIGEELVGGPTAQGVPIGSGPFPPIVQKVGFIGSGNLVSIEQEIFLRVTGLGSFVTVEQTIQTIGSGVFVSIEQKINDVTITSRVDRAGWDAILKVGSLRIPKSQVTSVIRVVRTESDSALLDVTIRPATGAQDLTIYQGKNVTLDVEESTGITRVYTGIVDIIDIDINRETLTLRCSNRREELVNSQFVTKKNTVGFYSDLIFSEPQDVNQEVEQRLETIPFSLDFDSKNLSHITAWQPKTTANFILDDPDVYLQRPEVVPTHRGRVVNQINIDFEYRYDRNYHWQRRWQWESPINDSPCLLLADGYSRFKRSDIQSAVDSAGWPLNGTIAFDSDLDDGWFRCGDVDIAFSNSSTQEAVFQTFDSSGNAITDSNGNPIASTNQRSQTTDGGATITYSNVTRTVTDFSNVFAEEATWFGTQRWAQTISEKFTTTVKAPQSITQYGLVERDETHGVESPFNSAVWEDYEAFGTAEKPAGSGTTYFIDRDTNISEFNEAWITVLNRAKTTILGSHRDNRVIFSRALWTPIDLRHTVQLTTAPVACKGKVFRIEHTLNVFTSEAVTRVELALSQSIGSQSDDVLTLPTRLSDTPNIPTDTIRLDNHFGVEPKGTFSGAIGNRFLRGEISRTQFPEQFIVDSPDVPQELREQRTLTGTESFNVQIPNDSLTITFDGKLNE